MWILLSFGACLTLFTAIGLLSIRQKKDSVEDYLVAGRSVGPWLTALSSVATNNSGFMFVGLIGFTYRLGLHTLWMAVAWVLGDLAVWLWVHPRVRTLSEERSATSVPGLLGGSSQGPRRPIVVASALITFLFLSGYAAAQLNAGSTALRALFGVEPWVGAVIGAVIVMVYCYAGGLRASIWTDAAQAVVMLGSMGLLLALAVAEVGGFHTLAARLTALDPSLMSLYPPDLALGFPLYFAGFLAGGFGAIGAPHILVRSMAIESTEAIRKARWVYYAWFVPFYAAAILVALYARVLLPELGLGEQGAQAVATAEGALPELAKALMSDVLVGLMLAGLFSATMSTADSQLLSCSAAITQDLMPQLSASTVAAKAATALVTALALAIAITASDSVFALVLGAWSALGASLGPVLLLTVFRQPFPTWLGLAMMGVGLSVVTGWAYTPWSAAVFRLLPGLLAPLALYAVWRMLRRPSAA